MDCDTPMDHGRRIAVLEKDFEFQKQTLVQQNELLEALRNQVRELSSKLDETRCGAGQHMWLHDGTETHSQNICADVTVSYKKCINCKKRDIADTKT